MSTIEKVCSGDLFIARANDVFTVNCNILKDISKSVDIIGIRGMWASCSAAKPVMIVATTTLSSNFSSWGGKPAGLKEFKNSCG